MTVRSIRITGDPVLHTPAREVVVWDSHLRQLVADMVDTMKFAIDLYAKDAATARALKDLTENKFLPFLKERPARGGDSEIKRRDAMMKQLKLETKGKSVSARMTVDAEMLKSLLPQ